MTSSMKLVIPTCILPQSSIFSKMVQFVVVRHTMVDFKRNAEAFPMKILVTNDDGIYSDALWALVKELTDIAQVLVVAPDREQSAIGTAVTLRQVLRVKKIEPLVPEVETYSVEGTPSDSVILALGKLAKGELDMVISGINLGLNLGEDVHISGTVGRNVIIVPAVYIVGIAAGSVMQECRGIIRRPNEYKQIADIRMSYIYQELRIIYPTDSVNCTTSEATLHLSTCQEMIQDGLIGWSIWKINSLCRYYLLVQFYMRLCCLIRN